MRLYEGSRPRNRHMRVDVHGTLRSDLAPRPTVLARCGRPVSVPLHGHLKGRSLVPDAGLLEHTEVRAHINTIVDWALPQLRSFAKPAGDAGLRDERRHCARAPARGTRE